MRKLKPMTTQITLNTKISLPDKVLCENCKIADFVTYSGDLDDGLVKCMNESICKNIWNEIKDLIKKGELNEDD